jgi:hypothetical protein
MDVEKKQAYLHIPEIKKKIEGFTPHEFDNHPIHAVHDMTHAELEKSPQLLQRFSDEMTSWRSTPHHEAWKNRHKSEFSADAEAYKARGKSKPVHHFEGAQLMTQPHKQSSPSPSAPAQPAAPAPAAQESVDFSQLPAELRAKYAAPKKVE